MTAWLTLSLGLLLGQTPPGTTSLPPDADTQDPAALELRDAWERALNEAEATDEGQGQADDTVQMPVLDVGSPDSSVTVPVARGLPANGTAAQEAPGIGGAGSDTATQEGTAPQGEEAPPPATTMRQELDRLRTQVESLQSQLETQQQEATARTGLVEQQIVGMQERAQQQEQLRTQRLDLLESAGLWVLAADQALAVGELDIGDALDEADSALADALENATTTGNGQTVLLLENVRTRLAFALEAAGRRSVYEARWALYDANFELREARRQALDRTDPSVLTP
ncbi:MAG TPA: hypothetical protein VF815_25535 [Myxococcaceae bacterium]|jgi:hypothetical protein